MGGAAEAAARTTTPATVPATYRFAGFTLDLARGALLGPDGAELPLRPKSFALLRLLVEHAGRLLDRDAIMAVVWPGVFVTDESVTQCVRDVRKALGDDAQRLLRTVPKRGYLLAARVTHAEPTAATPEGSPPPSDGTGSQPPPAPAPERLEPKGPSASPGAERRQLTALFCDLADSTALAERLDPEELSGIIRAYQERCAATLARFGGHATKLMGDGVLAYFGYPQAREDAAERAVRAGLAVVGTIEDLGASLDFPLQARVGIATGLVVSEPIDGDGREGIAAGRPLNLAARLQAVAEPGTVVIAEATRRLVGELFELEELGSHPLKGFAAPVPAWRVAGEGGAESRFTARRKGDPGPMVGRDQELALLLERWRLARGGEGQLVLLTGEAGIGKSRAARALMDAVAAEEPHLRVLWQCSPYHTDSALHPAAQQLAFAAGFRANDATEQRLDKLEALLTPASGRVREVAPLLAALLGLDGTARYGPLTLTPERQRARMLEALVDQLMGLARARPVLVVVEDAHWIDPTTLELIELALDPVARARALILVTARPTFQHGFGGHPIVTRLALNRLGRAAAEAIVTRLVADRALGEPVRDRILAQTDGVPLFIEELTKAVLEAGAEGMEVPASLHDSLMARLDRSADVRHVAQAAACIGREFDHGLLASVVDIPEPDLDAAMSELVRAELVFRRGTPPEASYSFKHALVRDAAHHSLLKSRRRELHGRVARALERQPGTADAPEIVAYHLSEAEIADDAVGWWLMAGRRAIGHSAYVEAARHLERGLADAAKLDAGPSRTRYELELYTTLGNALIFAKGFAAVETAQAFGEARRRSGLLDDKRRLAAILYGEWVVHNVRAEHEAAFRVATELSERLEGTDDPVALIIGHRLLGVSSHFLGRAADALSHFERLLALRIPADDGEPIVAHAYDPYVVALGFSSHSLLQLGRFGEARRRVCSALARARELAHPATVAFALWRACIFANIGRTEPATGGETQELCAVAAEYRFPHWAAVGCVFRGRVLLLDGAPGAAVSEISAGLAALQASGARLALVHDLALLARAHEASGDRWHALALLDEAIEHADRSGERWYDAELHRMRADLLLRSGRGDEAAAGFARAIEVARGQDAALWELRGGLGLARLRRDQGKRAEARDALMPSYERFTEGWDTPDLKEAEALLGELA